jgi:molybdenum cofactor cytidylyltransferase
MIDFNIVAVILAAGSSSRLGRAKQLLKFGENSLLEHTTAVVQQVIGASNTILVLGANAATISQSCHIDNAVRQVINLDWDSGMSSSIRIGLKEAMKQHCDAVLFVLCDQPFIDVNLLQDMIRLFDQKKGIIASNYNGKNGVPAIFDANFFPDLLNLNGQEGAKKIIEANHAEVTSVSFPLGAWDVDTEADVKRLLEFKKASEGF